MRRNLTAATAAVLILFAPVTSLTWSVPHAAAVGSKEGLQSQETIAVLFADEQGPGDIEAFEDRYTVKAVRPIPDPALISFTGAMRGTLDAIKRDPGVVAASVVTQLRRQQAVSASSSTSTLTAAPGCVVSNGASGSTITVTVRDSSGNPLSGVSVSISKTPTSSSAVVSPASQTTNSSGVATFTAVDTTKETVTLLGHGWLDPNHSDGGRALRLRHGGLHPGRHALHR